MLIRDNFYINGQWAVPSNPETIDVHNAGTGEVMGQVPAGGHADIDDAVHSARLAFDGWSQLPVAKRAEYLAKISAGLQKRA